MAQIDKVDVQCNDVMAFIFTLPTQQHSVIRGCKGSRLIDSCLINYWLVQTLLPCEGTQYIIVSLRIKSSTLWSYRHFGFSAVITVYKYGAILSPYIHQVYRQITFSLLGSAHFLTGDFKLKVIMKSNQFNVCYLQELSISKFENKV